jgi:hypothetical protein
MALLLTIGTNATINLTDPGLADLGSISKVRRQV